jgi:retron-type reverse transcriptase
MKIQLTHTFEDIICLENLFAAWREFVRGKRKRRDLEEFSLRLADNIIALHSDLNNLTYKHGGYQAFNISDPKPRNIHKATVRDRLLHHAIYRVLYPFFEKIFIADSYSCQIGKGAHKAINRFRKFAYIASKNNVRTCWILKCDIRKFFANIDHEILKNILMEYIGDKNILWLLSQVIDSFTAFNSALPRNIVIPAEAGIQKCHARENTTSQEFLDPRFHGDDESKNLDYKEVGLPLGNLTSQLFVNIYMNEFDQFAKHKIKARYYIRYADDFVIFSEDRKWLENIVPEISEFLESELKLSLHPEKVFIKTISSGVDFLGWVNFSDHRVLRTATKRRMLKRIRKNPKPETINSYLGMLRHGNADKLKLMIAEKCNP